MTPQQLRHAGEALYGPQWQTALADDLGVNPRTLRRWVAGSLKIGDWVRADTVKLMRAKIARLKQHVAEMEEWDE